jgi:hypothetical protein
MMSESFQNRVEAGKLLAGQLKEYANRSDVLVLALPRGGVPVGYEVAKALQAPGVRPAGCPCCSLPLLPRLVLPRRRTPTGTGRASESP